MKIYRDSKYIIHPCGKVENAFTGKFLRDQSNGKGYRKVTLTTNGIPIQRYVHRLVAELYVKKTSSKLNQVNHIDGDKSNNHFSNLEWVTNSENQIHAHKNGLKQNGNKLWNGKFSKSDIDKMKSLKASGTKQIDIAEIFNTTKSTISDILSGKRYKYV